MSGYYRAPVLDRYVRALDARWPHRDRRSDGWIGDHAHQLRKSDHNPDWTSKPPGVVRAEDTDNGPGVHVPTVLASCFLNPATHYVIYQTTIWTSERHFRAARYTGTPHTQHVHLSIAPGRERLPVKWTLIETVPSWGAGVRQGTKNTRAARECQAYLIAYGAPLVLDGNFGPASVKALRSFQRRHGLTVDAIAGPKTLARMRTA